ncbi:phosphopantothenoylcysteine decarboxylase [Burkholderia ambifaria]|uniref:phosphopantothenoylcysteine decarboxylase n=1 Tax=Burkholderia ambifaria TaxID=152480 RepID=UPI0013E0E757|nr:phosphopantothenoylcysteine decarboxylase [Burkholderia ambifaria]
MTKSIHIFGGGTVMHVRNHLALCAPAYGTTARKLAVELENLPLDMVVKLHLTKMADRESTMETNQDVTRVLYGLLSSRDTRAIIFNVAMCDFSGQIDGVESGKYAERLQTRGARPVQMELAPTPKVLASIKIARPDVLVVGFKTTAGETEIGQKSAAERQIRETGVDVVFANDTVTRNNMLVDAKGICLRGSREDVLEMLALSLQVRLQ